MDNDFLFYRKTSFELVFFLPLALILTCKEDLTQQELLS